MHHRSIFTALLVTLLTFAPAWAGPQGTVRGPDRAYFSAFDVAYPTVVDLQPRDVLDVVRNGAVIGQALVIDNAGHIVVVLPRGDMRAGDTVRLAHRASQIVTREAAVQPAWNPNAAPVVVTGRAASSSAPVRSMGYGDAGSYATSGFGYGGAGYGYYGYGYGYYGRTPQFNATLQPAPRIPGEIPHPAMPSMLGTPLPNPVYHPPMPSVADPGFHRSR